MPVTTMKKIKPKEPKQMDWSKIFRQFRQRHLYTQSLLAESLDCSRRAIVAIECGQTSVPSFTLQRKFATLKQQCEREEIKWTA